MKLARTFVYSSLLLLAISLPAVAQEPAGKFTVAHQTRWGRAVLPAGSYLVSVHSGPVPYVIVQSEKTYASIMAVAQYVTSAECKGSSLELEQTDGTWNVRSLCFQSQSIVYFGLAKTANLVTAKARPPAAALTGSN